MSRSHRPGSHPSSGAALVALASLMTLSVVPATAAAESEPELVYRPVKKQKQLYSPSTAKLLPLGGVMGSLALLVLAGRMESPGIGVTGLVTLVVTPSLGHIYTGDWGHALVPMGLRVSGLILMTAGFIGVVDRCIDDFFDDCSRPDFGEKVAPAALLTGIAAFLAGNVYSFWDAGATAHRKNGAPRMMLVPRAMSGADGSMGMGLSLTTRF